MRKHKKHPTDHGSQKLKLIQHKKDFIRRFIAFTKAYLGNEGVAFLTNGRIDRIYKRRIHTIKIIEAEGLEIPLHDKKLIEYYISNQLSEEKTKATDGSKISLTDFLSLGASLLMLLELEFKSSPDKNFFFCKLYTTFQNDYLYSTAPYDLLTKIVEGIPYINNDLSSHHYWVGPQIEYIMKDDATTGQYLKLHRTLPEKRNFTIDNQSRPAIKLGWVRVGKGVEYIQVSPLKFGAKAKHQTEPMDIYLQAHALLRLSERLDCLPKSIIHYYVFMSMLNPKVITDNQGRTLVEYHITNRKAGYLVVDIADGCILVRTFLFLTNNGTPEGQKLFHLTGLGKLDKKYLSIDKLSAFISSDIRSNESVMRVLQKSGCECLLELHENIRSVVTMHDKGQETGGLMGRYLVKSY